MGNYALVIHTFTKLGFNIMENMDAGFKELSKRPSRECIRTYLFVSYKFVIFAFKFFTY